MMYKHFILPFTVFIGSYMPTTAAQTAPPPIVPTQQRAAAVTTTSRTVPAPVPTSSFRPSQDAGRYFEHFSYTFPRPKELNQNLESLSPIHEVKTLFLTQSTLPLLQFGGGHLWLDGFTSTLNMQNVQLGPSAAGGLLDFRPQQAYMVGPRSIQLYGVNLSFHFRRNAQVGRPGPIWQSVGGLLPAFLVQLTAICFTGNLDKYDRSRKATGSSGTPLSLEIREGIPGVCERFLLRRIGPQRLTKPAFNCLVCFLIYCDSL
jgi:hypothetical protein